MDYKIYEKREILNSGINLRDSESMVFTLFFTINSFKFAVVYKPRYFNSSRGLAHFDFYALSRGFEKFTSTGYRSVFVQNSKEVASYMEIEAYFMELLKEKIDFEKPMQFNLFDF